MKKYRKPYRIKKRKSVLKSRWFWRLVLFLILAGEIFYVIYFFSFFQLKEIKISGNVKVKTADLYNEVQSQIARKLFFTTTRSIFLVNSNQIEELILEKFPPIAKANSKRKLPDKLIIDVEERKPVAVFCQAESCFFLDKEGIVFEPVTSETQLLRLTERMTEAEPLSALSGMDLGARVLEEKMVSSILEIQSKLKEDLKIPIAEGLIVSDDRLNVKAIEGWEIYFNPQKDLSWQITKLKAVLEKEIPQEKRKNLEYIEIRFGNLSPYKYR